MHEMSSIVEQKPTTSNYDGIQPKVLRRLDMKSGINPLGDAYVAVWLNDGENKIQTVFVDSKPKVRFKEVVLPTGQFVAEKTGAGIGSAFLATLQRVLQELANIKNQTIIHPLRPDSDRSKAFFLRNGYSQEANLKWTDSDRWLIKIFTPKTISEELSEEELQLVDELKKFSIFNQA